MRLYYEEAGAGPPVLLIAGFQGGAYSWRPQIDDLAKSFHCITLDNRGAGRSDKPEEPYTIEIFADDALAVLDHLGIKQAHIVGSSMGGMIAQHIAVYHPNRLLTLSLHCTAPASDPYIQRISEVYQELSHQFEVMDRFWVDLFCFSHDTYVRRYEDIQALAADIRSYPMPSHAFRKQLAALTKHDLTDHLSEIDKPTLIGCGSEDQWMPPSASRLMNDLIDGSRLEIFQGKGHLYKWEDPTGFNHIQRQFLLEHASDDRSPETVPKQSTTKE